MATGQSRFTITEIVSRYSDFRNPVMYHHPYRPLAFLPSSFEITTIKSPKISAQLLTSSFYSLNRIRLNSTHSDNYTLKFNSTIVFNICQCTCGVKAVDSTTAFQR